MTTELGTCCYQIIPIENPFSFPITILYKSTNPLAFSLGPVPPNFIISPSKHSQMKLPPIVQKEITIPPKSKSGVLVSYTPTAISALEEALLILTSKEGGTFKYFVKGF
jgi:hypothetical protein